MKYLFTLSMLIISINVFGQDKLLYLDKSIVKFPIDSVTQKVSYSGVEMVDSVKKDELYNRAFEWIVNSFKSANNVIQMKDKEAGILIIKGIFVDKKSFRKQLSTKFTLTIRVKDGKYKYEFTDLIYVHDKTEYIPNIEINFEEITKKDTVIDGNVFKAFFPDVDKDIRAFAADLKKTMNQKSKGDF